MSRLSVPLIAALLSLPLVACTPDQPPADTGQPADAAARSQDHLDTVNGADPVTGPQVDDYHRAAPEHKLEPEDLPEVPPPDGPLPRLEGDPTPLPAEADESHRPYREEPTGSNRPSVTPRGDTGTED